MSWSISCSTTPFKGSVWMGMFRNWALLTNQLLSHLICFYLCPDFLSKILKTYEHQGKELREWLGVYFWDGWRRIQITRFGCAMKQIQKSANYRIWMAEYVGLFSPILLDVSNIFMTNCGKKLPGFYVGCLIVHETNCWGKLVKPFI